MTHCEFVSKIDLLLLFKC